MIFGNAHLEDTRYMKLVPLLMLATGALLGSTRQGNEASAGAAAATKSTVITVEANDFSLTLPSRVPAGVVTFRLVNHGKELHHAQVIRLEHGKTAGDYMKAFTDSGPMAPWVKYLGGPAGTPAGQVHATTTRLTPGHYAVMCRVVSPDGVIHLMKGMIREFEVVARKAGGLDSLPAGTDTVTLTDYGFASSRPLTMGHHTIRVNNGGPQPHELVMLTLAPGKTRQTSPIGDSPDAMGRRRECRLAASSSWIRVRATSSMSTWALETTGSSASCRMPRTASDIICMA